MKCNECNKYVQMRDNIYKWFALDYCEAEELLYVFCSEAHMDKWCKENPLSESSASRS